MNINENDVAKLVQQVLQEMTSGAPASAPKAQAVTRKNRIGKSTVSGGKS